jgi:hypothetical protein
VIFSTTFFYKDEPTPDSPILIEAYSIEEARVILQDKVNSGIDIPGNWDRYSKLESVMVSVK